MRKWHRWLSFIFGAFLLFIAVTGHLRAGGEYRRVTGTAAQVASQRIAQRDVSQGRRFL